MIFVTLAKEKYRTRLKIDADALKHVGVYYIKYC